MKKDVLKKAFVATVPVLSGYLVIGLSFGVVLQSRGYGALWSAAMSAFIYAGSMQFVAVELMSSAASLFTVALTTLMVNMRHVFYGLSMIDRYKNTGKAKPYLIFALTDETYSLVCNPPELPREEEKTSTSWCRRWTTCIGYWAPSWAPYWGPCCPSAPRALTLP